MKKSSEVSSQIPGEILGKHADFIFDKVFLHGWVRKRFFTNTIASQPYNKNHSQIHFWLHLVYLYVNAAQSLRKLILLAKFAKKSILTNVTRNSWGRFCTEYLEEDSAKLLKKFEELNFWKHYWGNPDRTPERLLMVITVNSLEKINYKENRYKGSQNVSDLYVFYFVIMVTDSMRRPKYFKLKIFKNCQKLEYRFFMFKKYCIVVFNQNALKSQHYV